MLAAKKTWFTPDARRAGWISVCASAVLIGTLFALAHPINSARLFLVFPILPISLGCLAVAALNFRRWHALQESVAAAILAAVDAHILIACFIALGFLLAGAVERAPLLMAVLLFYFLIPFALYVALSLIVTLLVACASGAILYLLLSVMRSFGKPEQFASSGESVRPRPLQLVV